MTFEDSLKAEIMQQLEYIYNDQLGENKDNKSIVASLSNWVESFEWDGIKRQMEE
jgi:hypothetical protein